jgi:DNA-binding beta-propeller fold protein YncE
VSARTRSSFLALMSILGILLAGALSYAPAASATTAATTGRTPSAPASGHYHSGRAAAALLPRSGSRAFVDAGFGSARVGIAPTQPYPASIAVDTRTDTIYVANGYDPDSPPSGGDTVTVIDGRHCRAADVSRCKGPWPTVKVGNQPGTLAIDQVTNTIYVTNFADGTVSVIDGATCDAEVRSGCGQTTPTISFGASSGPLGILADHANHTVYVALPGTDFSQSTIAVIDTSHCRAGDLAGCASQVPSAFSVGVGPSDLALNPATHTVYVAQFVSVAAFDADTCNARVMTGCGHIGTTKAIQQLSCGDCAEFAVQVDQANDTIYAADGAQDSVSVINGRTCDAADLAGCATHKLGTVQIGPVDEIEGVIWVAVDGPAHTVYAVNHKDDDISAINADACNGSHLAACARMRPPTVHTGTNPESVAVNPLTQTVYVGNAYDHDVAVIAATQCDASATTGCRHPAPTVSAGSGPDAVAVDQSVGTAYVADGTTPADRTISLINVRTCKASDSAGCPHHPATVRVAPGPDGVAIDDATHTAYAASFGTSSTGAVAVISTTGCNATVRVSCDRTHSETVRNGNPQAIAVNTATNTIYVAVLPASGPSLIDVYGGASCRAGHVQGCGHPPAVITVGKPGYAVAGLAVDQATNTVYATETNGALRGNQLYVINGAACDAGHSAGCGATPAATTVGLSPEGVAVDQATDTVYVADLRDGEGNGAVSVVNGATCDGTDTSGCSTHPAATVRAGFGTIGVAIDSATDKIYATGDEDTSVSIINGATCNGSHLAGCGRQTPAKVAVGVFPTLIAVDHAEHTVYVIDNFDTTLTLIRAAR